MSRRTLIIAALCTAILVGAAILLQDLFWGAGETMGIPPTQLDRPNRNARESVDASPSAPERPDDSLDTPLVVAEPGSLEQLVEGAWRPVERGFELAKQDRIRTTSAGMAVLTTADGSRIDLVDLVEVSVDTLTQSLAEVELHRGRLRADLKKGGGLALRVRSSGATAEAKNGSFVVFADGTGMVAVASETAEVQLRARDQEVLIAAGEQSVVYEDGTPSAPQRVSDEVYLRVAWPQKRLRREKRLVLHGQVEPGSEVRVGGQRAAVGRDGSFATPVDLDSGDNRVIIEARDPLGRVRSEESPTLTVKNRPPRIEVLSQGSWSDGGVD
jgi:hypothetical protein